MRNHDTLFISPPSCSVGDARIGVGKYCANTSSHTLTAQKRKLGFFSLSKPGIQTQEALSSNHTLQFYIWAYEAPSVPRPPPRCCQFSSVPHHHRMLFLPGATNQSSRCSSVPDQTCLSPGPCTSLASSQHTEIPVPVSRVQGGDGISLKQKRLPAEHIGHPAWSQAEETFVSIGQAQSWVNCLEGSSAHHYTTCGLLCHLLLQMRESSASCSSRSEPHQLPAPPDQSLASFLLFH